MVQEPGNSLKLGFPPDALGKLFDILIKLRGNKGAGCMHPGLLTFLTGVGLLVQGEENIEIGLHKCRSSVDHAQMILPLYSMLDLVEERSGELTPEQGIIVSDDRLLQSLRIVCLQQLLE